jgi:hypothetical protein
MGEAVGAVAERKKVRSWEDEKVREEKKQKGKI